MRPEPSHRRPSRAGFSIVEVLVGFLILLLVVIGLLPIFTRGIIQNVSGRESTVVANHGRTRVEDRLQLTFNNWDLTIEDGTVRSAVDYWGQGSQHEVGDEGWTDSPDDEVAPWQRTTEIRQFSINGVNDTDLDGILDEIEGLEDGDYDGYFDSALNAGASPNTIHLKEVRVRVLSMRTPFGAGEPTELTLRGVKAF